MKRMICWKQGGCWMTDTLGEEADYVKRLFGTTELPTAFTTKMSFEELIHRLAPLNPGYEFENASVSE